MKQLKHFTLITLLLLSMFSVGIAQQKDDPKGLGKTASFTQVLKQKIATKQGINQRSEAASITVSTPDAGEVTLNIKYNALKGTDLTLVGEANGKAENSFFIKSEGSALKGNIILKDQNKAYEYYSDAEGNAYIKEKRMDKVMCVEYAALSPMKIKEAAKSAAPTEVAEAPNNLQSLPGAEAVVLLDFDGYQLPSGTGWLNGNSWYAPASGMSDSQITEAWELISEDYRPYNVNITTSQSVFDSYPMGRRVRCVFTPANDPAPGAGGVAYVGAFGYNDWPCWVFMMDGKVGGEAASHEIGHTVGLGHDGRTNPNEGYFLGHGDWAPIMGAGYYKPISQWSRGEYAYANNQEDDLSIMQQYIQRRGDDHGNNFAGSTFMDKDGAGNVATQYGVISTTGDVDMFRFTCGTGNVSLDINTVGRHGDLDVLVNLYEGSTGNLIGVFNGGGLNTHLDAYLDAGTYYLGVDGTGAGDPATNGYTDYASLGSFWITGVIPAGGGGGGGDYLSWEAHNQPGKIIRHAGNRGRIDSNVSPAADGNWKMVPGLAGAGVSFESTNFPGRFLRHRGGEIWLDNNDGSQLFKEDATFFARAGLADGNKYSFESYNFPGRFIRHRNSQLFNESITNDLGRSDATFAKLGNGNLPGGSSSFTIEAENFTSMSGVQTEGCSEGGSNVGWIDNGDWMSYANINFASTGRYLIEYRVATPNAGGVLSADLDAGANVLGTINIPNTGGWQSWTTVSHTVNVNAGTYPFGIYAQAGGWNINWIKVSYQGAAAAQAQSTPALAEAALLTQDDFNLYPNPASQSIKIGFANGTAEIKVMNALGHEVIAASSVEPNSEINISNLKRGIYFIQIKKDDVSKVKRFIKE
ncbi:AbfB domain-containing protein [Fulvivirga ligni]|uniref:AbfB domain-containing protein n=1 Tax=Fulvivirga ligni TaxID=2904246 RepID=UPI001F3453D2|nr:AbfB domain-containing protein [Fulvivirga ligni]UII19972.1 AbfB domain-containing protein [Fulvivirga ligni]